MDCLRCGASMQEGTLGAHVGRRVTIDLCQACQSFWSDAREGIRLTSALVSSGLTVMAHWLREGRMSNPNPAPHPLAMEA